MLIAFLVVAYNLVNHACPYPYEAHQFHVCMTSYSWRAALLYKIGSFPFFYLFIWAGLYGTERWSERAKLSGFVAVLMLPATFFMHLLYFLLPGNAVYNRADLWNAFDLLLLVLLFIWAVRHRTWAERPAFWRRLDPDGVIPPGDRHRAIFWHPMIALFFHQLAATTDLWTITFV